VAGKRAGEKEKGGAVERTWLGIGQGEERGGGEKKKRRPPARAKRGTSAVVGRQEGKKVITQDCHKYRLKSSWPRKGGTSEGQGARGAKGTEKYKDALKEKRGKAAGGVDRKRVRKFEQGPYKTRRPGA